MKDIGLRGLGEYRDVDGLDAQGALIPLGLTGISASSARSSSG